MRDVEEDIKGIVLTVLKSFAESSCLFGSSALSNRFLDYDLSFQNVERSS